VSVYAWNVASRVAWDSGQVRILVLEFLPPGAEPSEGLRRFNEADSSAEASLQSAGAWLAGEFAEHRVAKTDLDVDFVVSGPHAVPIDPPDLAESGLVGWRRGLRALSYYWYWRRLAADLGADFEGFDARLVVLLEPDASRDIESGSVADPKQRFGVVRLDADLPDPNYAAITLLHELGHALGAGDKYDPTTYRARWPEGFAEPGRTPVFPQRFGELMAIDIPLGPSSEREPRDLSELRIGARTAAEFGWIPPSLAVEHYEGTASRPAP
jgi:hypothetical protein